MSNLTQEITNYGVNITALDCHADNAVGGTNTAEVNWRQLINASAGDILADAAGGGNLFSACQTTTVLSSSSSYKTLIVEKYSYFSAKGQNKRESTVYYAVDLKGLRIYEIYEERPAER